MDKLYVDRLVEWMKEHRNEKEAEPMSQYMRNQFAFLGIKTLQRKQLLKDFFTRYGLPPLKELDEILLALWNEPEREFQYAALFLLEKNTKKLTSEHIELAEKLIITKSWWDTVDYLAANIVGTILKKQPGLISTYAEKWIHSNNIWLQRTALLFQLKYKKETDELLLYRYTRTCISSKEFFIQKAIGWVLREYSKVDPDSVIRFVESEDLPALSRREALKVINKVRDYK